MLWHNARGEHGKRFEDQALAPAWLTSTSYAGKSICRAPSPCEKTHG